MCPGDRGSSHRTEGIWGVSHPGSVQSLHMQNFWGICAPRALGASLHQKLLGYLCTWSLSEHLHMQTLWGVSAPRISGVSKHKTSRVSLHLWSISASKTFGAQGPWGISHRNLLGCLTLSTLETFHTQVFCTQSLWNISRHSGCLLPWALEHWAPRPSCREGTHEGSLGPTAQQTPTHLLPEAPAHPHRHRPVPHESAPRGARAQPQGARGAGREANSYGSARSGAAGEPEGSGTDPCRAVSSRAGS